MSAISIFMHVWIATGKINNPVSNGEGHELHILDPMCIKM